MRTSVSTLRSLSASTRTLLNCPFSSKDAVKSLGGQWCKTTKSWFVPRETKLEPFKSYLHPESFYNLPPSPPPPPSHLTCGSVTALSCPYEDKDTVKQLGATWSPSLKQWTVEPDLDLLPFIPYLSYDNIPLQNDKDDRFVYLLNACKDLIERIDDDTLTKKKRDELLATLNKANSMNGTDDDSASFRMIKQKDRNKASTMIFKVLATLSSSLHCPTKATAKLAKTLSKRFEGVCDITGVTLTPGNGWYHSKGSGITTAPPARGRDICEEVYNSEEYANAREHYFEVGDPSDLDDAEPFYYLEHGKRGLCHACGKRLVAVGNKREGGASHGDWNQRMYHKECWKSFGAGFRPI